MNNWHFCCHVLVPSPLQERWHLHIRFCTGAHWKCQGDPLLNPSQKSIGVNPTRLPSPQGASSPSSATFIRLYTPNAFHPISICPITTWKEKKGEREREGGRVRDRVRDRLNYSQSAMEEVSRRTSLVPAMLSRLNVLASEVIVQSLITLSLYKGNP